MAPQAMQPKAFTFTETARHDTYPEINPSTQDCSGKSILVTGANRGIGKAQVLSYARAGASQIAVGSRSDASDVVAACLAASSEAGKAAPAVIWVKLDVCDQASVDAALEQVKKEFGRLDVLVNNSGVLHPAGGLIDHPTETYIHTWDVNFWGTYRVTKAFLPLMLEGGDKTVIFTTSVGAHVVIPHLGAYNIGKFALCRLAEYVDVEYGEQGVLCYSYHPGGIITDLSLNLPTHVQGILTDTVELGADTLIFLTSKKRDWLAGRYLSANSDMPELMALEEEIVKGDLLKFKGSFGD
ncbi:short chain dehydrogenase reductase [Lasiosphaeris hirsuta]|uniref:Short chain dehydrogenase reductase n=1 Tax=Lasiosphaeris hirsuta TaxID=260670 RepID=A0AA40DX38_9PEZI|nr:short chain dehydrogenase reductase [Lasiosphaeris hirsuta]